jgi:catechol 2,3-dioxygenase-like lactoylglutathione lyase family enzyme
MKKALTILLPIFIYMNSFAQTETASFVEYEDAYSVYITKNLKASRDFYIQWLDFEIVFEASWFVFFQSKGDHKISFALIDENHPSSPPSYGTFNGRGSFLTLQVQDAAKIYDMLKSRNAPITYHLKTEDWGQVRFGLTDPNGLYIDIVQQAEPVKGYWNKYLPK